MCVWHRSGTVPSNFAVNLVLGRNPFTGHLPVKPVAQRGPTIEWPTAFIEAEQTMISGTLPEQYGALTSNIQSLDLRFTPHLSGTLPGAAWRRSTSLRDVHISYSKLEGTLPPELFALPTLKAVGIEMTRISGTLPSTLGRRTALGTLEINFNFLSGTLAPEIVAGMRSLSKLSLDDNVISGALPTQIGLVGHTIGSKLEELIITSNRLSGSLPSQLGRLRPNVCSLAADDPIPFPGYNASAGNQKARALWG